MPVPGENSEPGNPAEPTSASPERPAVPTIPRGPEAHSSHLFLQPRLWLPALLSSEPEAAAVAPRGGTHRAGPTGRDPPTRGFAEVRLSRSPRLPLVAEPHPPARPKWSHPQERAVARSRTSSQARASPALEAARRSATLLVWEKESDRWAPCVRSRRARFPTG